MLIMQCVAQIATKRSIQLDATIVAEGCRCTLHTLIHKYYGRKG